MVEPGRTCLGDRYELGGLIAAGGMGQVWRGTDVLLGRSVAVKVLRSEYTGDPSFLARFRAEAQNAAALSHPHIAAVFDYGETVAQDGSGETLAYLVMELVEGRPLSDVIRSSGRLDIGTTLRVLEQTASGLAEAHRAGMVHRDVKPGNLLVTPEGNVKITDFGIAWSARSVALTETGQVLGTPQYLSPEQAEGRHATPASDVYALGLIGYECLTGHPAFDGENAVTIALKQVREEPEPLPDDLPARIRALVRRSLAKDPAQRFPDGAAFVAAVAAVRAGRSIEAAPAETAAVAAVPSPEAEGTGGRTAVVGPGRAEVRRSPARRRRHRAPAAAQGTRSPARRRRSLLAVVLLPLLGLLAGAGIAAMVLQGLAGNGNPPAVAAQSADDGIVLDADDYVGRPADEVALQLAALGLTVQRESRETADQEPGTVVGVDPSGEPLEPGATVLLVVATAPDATGDGSGGEPAQEVAGSTAAVGSPEADAPAETSAPSDGADSSTEAAPESSSGAAGSSAADDPASEAPASSEAEPSPTGTAPGEPTGTPPSTAPSEDPSDGSAPETPPSTAGDGDAVDTEEDGGTTSEEQPGAGSRSGSSSGGSGSAAS